MFWRLRPVPTAFVIKCMYFPTRIDVLCIWVSICVCSCLQVIAVVMDVFTDVDIFRDLLDAGFKRKVSVYILLERTTLPHFESMCQRANMHAGHLKVSASTSPGPNPTSIWTQSKAMDVF